MFTRKYSKKAPRAITSRMLLMSNQRNQARHNSGFRREELMSTKSIVLLTPLGDTDERTKCAHIYCLGYRHIGVFRCLMTNGL